MKSSEKKNPRIRRFTILLAGIVLISLSSMQFSGCAPGRLDQVLINEAPARPHQMNAVQIIRKNRPAAAVLKMDLKEGDEIKTDGESVAIIWLLGGSKLILGPDTHIRLVNPGHIIDLLCRLSTKACKLFVEARGALKVNTEYVSAATEGTDFLIEQGPGNHVSVVVLDGAVRVESEIPGFIPLRLTRFQKATIRGGQPASIETLEREEVNRIIDWVNRIEKASSPEGARILMPDVVGLPVYMAERTLERMGFRIREKTGRITGRRPVDTVIQQRPEAGNRMGQGDAVTLYFEAEPVNVPSVIGMQREIGVRTLSNNRLVVGEIQERITGRAPAGTVIEQQPPPHTTVPAGCRISLIVEAQSAIVPQLRRMNIQQARERLLGARLRVGSVVETITGRAPAGTVVNQSPAQGTRVKPDTPVSLTIEAETVPVPHLVNLPIDRAIQELSRQRLRVGIQRRQMTDRHREGMVIAQSVPAGHRVRPGVSVDLTVAEAGVRVPNLLNRNIRDAESILRGAGLRIGRITTTQSSRHSPDSVISQQPGTGSLVRRNQAIDLVVAVKPPAAAPAPPVFKPIPIKFCTVPNLTGKSERDALNTLRASGLNGRVTRRMEGNPVVTHQNPLPNNRAPCGSVVEIWIGRLE